MQWHYHLNLAHSVSTCNPTDACRTATHLSSSVFPLSSSAQGHFCTSKAHSVPEASQFACHPRGVPGPTARTVQACFVHCNAHSSQAPLCYIIVPPRSLLSLYCQSVYTRRTLGSGNVLTHTYLHLVALQMELRGHIFTYGSAVGGTCSRQQGQIQTTITARWSLNRETPRQGFPIQLLTPWKQAMTTLSMKADTSPHSQHEGSGSSHKPPLQAGLSVCH